MQVDLWFAQYFHPQIFSNVSIRSSAGQQRRTSEGTSGNMLYLTHLIVK